MAGFFGLLGGCWADKRKMCQALLTTRFEYKFGKKSIIRTTVVAISINPCSARWVVVGQVVGKKVWWALLPTSRWAPHTRQGLPRPTVPLGPYSLNHFETVWPTWDDQPIHRTKCLVFWHEKQTWLQNRLLILRLMPIFETLGVYLFSKSAVFLTLFKRGGGGQTHVEIKYRIRNGILT